MTRSLALAFFATLALSSNALAQKIVRPGARAPEPTYGSVERTKLLAQIRGGRDESVLELGSVERRAILTGARVQLPHPPPRSRSRSRR